MPWQGHEGSTQISSSHRVKLVHEREDLCRGQFIPSLPHSLFLPFPLSLAWHKLYLPTAEHFHFFFFPLAKKPGRRQKLHHSPCFISQRVHPQETDLQKNTIHGVSFVHHTHREASRNIPKSQKWQKSTQTMSG